MYTGGAPQPAQDLSEAAPLHQRYLWGIASVAALGGLLFGYDWVVIGGAKPFYEAYFHLYSESQVGWANSCALIGCLLGSLAAGALSDHFGRKPVLIAAAILFPLSSLCTGWAHLFSTFIAWRITGGLAMGWPRTSPPPTSRRSARRAPAAVW